jgi:hypothetical protein
MNARQVVEAEAERDYARMRQAWPLHKKRDSLMRERASRVALNQALAQAGIPEQDMASVIVGAQLGRTDNYKRSVPTKVCQSRYCELKGRPQGDFENCDECGEPLVASTRQLSFSDLHGDMANSIVGVVTRDGRRVFFDQPVPQRPWSAWEREDNPRGPRQRPNLPIGSPRRAVRAGRGY